MLLKELDKAIDEKLIDVFQSYGLMKRRKAVFGRILEGDKECEILIEKSDRRTGTKFYVNPIITFTYYKIENLGKELASDFYPPNYIINTLSKPLGYFLPGHTYKTYNFSISSNDKLIHKTVQLLIHDIEKYAIPKLMELCNDEILLQTLKSNSLGLQITNRIKAPLLLCVLNRKKEALELATEYLKEIRPTPKDMSIDEPEEFATVDDAYIFFRRDEDIRYYFFYRKFYTRLKKFVENKEFI